MSTHGASPYFTERARESWRTLGYGCMAFPFLWNLHAPTPVVVFASAAFVVPPIWNLAASHQERNGDKLPTSIAYHALHEERRELGSFTFRCLLDKWKAEMSFEDLITQAANCSNEFGRRLCVIYVRIPELQTIAADLWVNLLREHVRSTDEVRNISASEVVVCAPLLRDSLAAEVIHERLARAIRGAGLSPPSSEIYLGKAIYPMAGYTGAELIRHARLTSRAIV